MRNILDLWTITIEELSEAIFENGSLRGMLLGYVAEIKLKKYLQGFPEVTSVQKDDDHDRRKKGDLRISYRDQEFKIESKSLQTNKNQKLLDGTFLGYTQVDASDKRTVTFEDGSQVQTTNLLVGEFDVLAVNCFTFEEKWHFIFAANEDLPRSKFNKYTEYQQQNLLATLMTVTWPPTGIYTDNLFEVLDDLIERRKAPEAAKTFLD